MSLSKFDLERGLKGFHPSFMELAGLARGWEGGLAPADRNLMATAYEFQFGEESK
jgi:hypothetical protein